MIRVVVNGRKERFPPGLTLHAMLQGLPLADGLVRVERNGEVVCRERYPTTTGADGDRLEVVYFLER